MSGRNLGTVVAVDSGGTFSDCVILDEHGRVTIAKAPSTPADFSLGVLGSVEAAARLQGLERDELLQSASVFGHGTTAATNALLTRTGEEVGLLTTKGHEDALIIGRTIQKAAGLTTQELTNLARLEKARPTRAATPHQGRHRADRLQGRRDRRARRRRGPGGGHRAGRSWSQGDRRVLPVELHQPDPRTCSPEDDRRGVPRSDGDRLAPRRAGDQGVRARSHDDAQRVPQRCHRPSHLGARRPARRGRLPSRPADHAVVGRRHVGEQGEGPRGAARVIRAGGRA